MFQRHGLAADFRRARPTLAQKIEGPLGQIGEIGGRVTQHILGHRAAEELRNEGGRDVVAALSQGGAGQFDDGVGGVVLLADGKFNGHGGSRGLRELVEHGLKSFHFPERAVESNTPFGDAAVTALSYAPDTALRC